MDPRAKPVRSEQRLGSTRTPHRNVGFYVEDPMSDMRLVVAGAGGRMGRTVIKAIAETGGVVLAGAIDAPGAAVIGRDAGELAGLGPNGIAVSAEAPALLAQTDGLIDFTIPAATLALVAQSAAHGLVHIIGTTGFSPEHEKI